MCFQEMEGERDSLDKSPASIIKDNMVALLGVLTLLNFLFCIPTYRDLSWTENLENWMSYGLLSFAHAAKELTILKSDQIIKCILFARLYFVSLNTT